MKSSEKDACAYLTITADTLPLDDITRFLEKAPDGSSWSLGDVRRVPNKLRPKYEFSRWSLTSGVPKGQPLEAHFVGLCQRMSPLSGKLSKLPAEMHAMISITGRVDNYDNPLFFSAGTLREIGAYGFPLDFDLYSENG